MLAMIGPQWATLADDQGRVRLLDPDDFVRKEISTALAGPVRVIPVLVNGAKMPDRKTLPPDLQGLTRRQAMEVRHERFHDDMAALAEAVATTTPGARARRWQPLAVAAVVLLGAGAAIFALWPDEASSTSSTVTTTAETAVETKGCKPGFVWRSAAFGDNTCRDGYVWREAFQGDLVCVTPFERDKANRQNADADANHN